MSGQLVVHHPRPSDEPSFTVKLYGRNEAPCVRINGWTHYFPTEFPNLPYPKRVKTVARNTLVRADVQGMGSAHNRMKKRFNDRAKLSELIPHVQPGSYGKKMNNKTVCVTVIAKKEQELVTKNDGTVLIFGTMVVGDDSGTSIIKVVNAAVDFLYNQVDVGDCLLLSYFTLLDSTYLQNQHGVFQNFFPFVLKVGEFQCYHVVKLTRSVAEINSTFTNITQGTRLWSPSTLQAETHGLAVLKEGFGDLIGVVSHLSRLERWRKFTSNVQLYDGSERDLAQFDVQCWIELIDEDAKEPIPISIRVNSLFWQKQGTLVPGSLIVITNVGLPECSFHYPHLRTTPFSQVYANHKVFEYFVLMRGRRDISEVIQGFLDFEYGLRVLSRKDIVWSIGGGYVSPVKNQTDFYKAYFNMEINGLKWNSVPSLPLSRRESQTVVFKGWILRYNLFNRDWDNDFPSWEWIDESIFQRMEVKHRTINRVYDPIPVHTKNTSLWYLFTRALPRVTKEDLLLSGTDNDYKLRKTKIYEAASELYRKYSPPLLMPSVPGTKKLKGLPAIDGAPHYAVDLLNAEGELELMRHVMTWKPSRNANLNQIKAKLEQLRGKEIIALVKLHRIESLGLHQKFGYEFVIEDLLPFLGDSTTT